MHHDMACPCSLTTFTAENVLRILVRGILRLRTEILWSKLSPPHSLDFTYSRNTDALAYGAEGQRTAGNLPICNSHVNIKLIPYMSWN